jgi:hypothetical protein
VGDGGIGFNVVVGDGDGVGFGLVTGGLVGIIIGSTGAIGGIGISHRCIPQHFILRFFDLGFGNVSLSTRPPFPSHTSFTSIKHLKSLQRSSGSGKG